MELIIELAEAELDEVSGGLIRFSSFSANQTLRGGDAFSGGGRGGDAAGSGEATGGDGGDGGTATGGFGGLNLIGIVDASRSTTPDEV